VIEVPTVTTADEWIAYYDAADAGDGHVLLYKALDTELKSGYGFLYLPGTSVEAPDWDAGARECGGGLHFCASPFHARGFRRYSELKSTRFVACKVKVADIAVHAKPMYPNKVKAPRCEVLYECDVDGKELAQAEVAATDGRSRAISVDELLPRAAEVLEQAAGPLTRTAIARELGVNGESRSGTGTNLQKALEQLERDGVASRAGRLPGGGEGWVRSAKEVAA
jgi:hypothetical protein